MACEWLVVDTYRTPSLRTYSSFSAKPFFWKTAMTALWMLQYETHEPALALRAASGSWHVEQLGGGGGCVPVPFGVGSRPLLLLSPVLRRTFLALPQLAETGRAHQLEPMQSPHGGDMERHRGTLSPGRQEKEGQAASGRGEMKHEDGSRRGGGNVRDRTARDTVDKV